MTLDLIFVLSFLSFITGLPHPGGYFSPPRPLIIAHRGASGFIPEHTMQSYSTAVAMGADYIEPDVVLTQDKRFVVSHDLTLGALTNIGSIPQFACRVATRTFRNRTETGWFVDDLTEEEFLSLRGRQRYPLRDHSYDDLLPKVNLHQVLEYALSVNEQRRKNGETLLGVYIEPKIPAYFHEMGFDMETLLSVELAKHNLGTAQNATSRCPIILQSFDLLSLQALSKLTDLPRILLLESNVNITETLLEGLSSEVHGIGPPLTSLFSEDLTSTGVIESAHRHGLVVHGWTLKDDFNPFLKSLDTVYRVLLSSGIDGLFAEFPDHAKFWLQEFKAGNN